MVTDDLGTRGPEAHWKAGLADGPGLKMWVASGFALVL